MQLHRILFVFLGNLLKPLSRLIHLLCNEPAPPRALSHSSKQQGQLPSPAGLPADSLQRAERAVASSQPYFGYRLGPKSTCVSWGEARQTAAWGGRAEKPRVGYKHRATNSTLLYSSRHSSSLSASAEGWRLSSHLPLAPCPKKEKTNTLVILRLKKISQKWRTTYSYQITAQKHTVNWIFFL